MPEAMPALAAAARLAPESARYGYVYAVGLHGAGRRRAGDRDPRAGAHRSPVRPRHPLRADRLHARAGQSATGAPAMPGGSPSSSPPTRSCVSSCGASRPRPRAERGGRSRFGGASAPSGCRGVRTWPAGPRRSRGSGQLVELRVGHRRGDAGDTHRSFLAAFGVAGASSFGSCQPPAGETVWSASFGPQLPGSYSYTGVSAFSTGSTTRHASST